MNCRRLVFLMVATGSLSIWAEPAPASPGPPNIVYVMLDEWGYFEWSGAGHPIIDTPNIDRLAREGMRFTQFLAGANVCAPTRAAFMTGQHTGHTTVRNNNGTAPIRDEDVTIAEVLGGAGYVSAGFGKWGLGDAGTSGVPERQGFQTFFGYYHQVHAHTFYPRYLIRNSERVPLPGNRGDFTTGETFSPYLIHEEGLQFMRENHDRPFFAYLPWTPPHGQWGLPDEEPAWAKYRDLDWDAANQRGERDAQKYATLVEMVDRHLGEIRNLLEQLGIAENTLILLSGDNGGAPYFANPRHPHGFFDPNLNRRTGERFRGRKGNFYEGGLRIPFIAHWPGHIAAGTTSDHLGYFPDIMPTLAELVGQPCPAASDGISILSTLLGEDRTGQAQGQHDYLYWEDRRSQAVRWGAWKAIRPQLDTPWELYDLRRDLEETTDLSADYPRVLARMRDFADQAHTPPVPGVVHDPSVAFDGHLTP